jgi:hypothetical protein
MAPGVDSLNVSVAAGIVLHALCSSAPTDPESVGAELRCGGSCEPLYPPGDLGIHHHAHCGQN